MRDCYCPVRDGSTESPVQRTGPGTGPTQGDPWHAFGYLVSVSSCTAYRLGSGPVAGDQFLVAIGILVGAGFGIYMTSPVQQLLH